MSVIMDPEMVQRKIGQRLAQIEQRIEELVKASQEGKSVLIQIESALWNQISRKSRLLESIRSWDTQPGKEMFIPDEPEQGDSAPHLQARGAP